MDQNHIYILSTNDYTFEKNAKFCSAHITTLSNKFKIAMIGHEVAASGPTQADTNTPSERRRRCKQSRRTPSVVTGTAGPPPITNSKPGTKRNPRGPTHIQKGGLINIQKMFGRRCLARRRSWRLGMPMRWAGSQAVARGRVRHRIQPSQM